VQLQAVHCDRRALPADVQAEVLGALLQHLVRAAVGLGQRLQLAALAYVDQFGGGQGLMKSK
jgi:hypothetical protein